MYDILCCIICVFAVYGIYSALREIKMLLLRRAAKVALRSAEKDPACKGGCSCDGCCGECLIEIPPEDGEEY